MHPPSDLLDRCRKEPDALAVLIDWYEEQGDPHWAQWLRSGATGEKRRSILARALKKSGMRLRESDQRWFRLDERFAGPLLDTLSWTVKEPDRLDDLLRIPAFARATRVHLASWRPRTAIPTVLADLAARRPATRHLDVLDVPVGLDALAGFTGLQGLGLRLDRPHRAELAVRDLCIRTFQPGDLEAWLEVRTPALQNFEIHRVASDLPWDPTQIRPADIEALLDRPFDTISVDRGLYHAFRDVFDRASGRRVWLLPPRIVPGDEEAARWSVLA